MRSSHDRHCCSRFQRLVGSTAISYAQTVTWNSVQLSWTTPGDDSLTGTASQFDLRYSTSAITAANFNAATRWTRHADADRLGHAANRVTVTGLQPSTTYWFAIKTADEVPNWSGHLERDLSGPRSPRPTRSVRRRSPTLIVTSTTETTAALRWTAVGDDSLTGTASSLRRPLLDLADHGGQLGLRDPGHRRAGAGGARHGDQTSRSPA